MMASGKCRAQAGHKGATDRTSLGVDQCIEESATNRKAM
jgi:hypothetical protein